MARNPEDMLFDPNETWSHLSGDAASGYQPSYMRMFDASETKLVADMRSCAIKAGAIGAFLDQLGSHIALVIPEGQFGHIQKARAQWAETHTLYEPEMTANPTPRAMPQRPPLDMLRAKACQLLFYEGTDGWKEEQGAFDGDGRWIEEPIMTRKVICDGLASRLSEPVRDMLYALGAREFVITPTSRTLTVELPKREFDVYFAPEMTEKGPGVLRADVLAQSQNPRVFPRRFYNTDTGVAYMQNRVFEGGLDAWHKDEKYPEYVRKPILMNAHDKVVVAGPMRSTHLMLRRLGVMANCKFLHGDNNRQWLRVTVPEAEFESMIAPRLQAYGPGELQANVEVPAFRAKGR